MDQQQLMRQLLDRGWTEDDLRRAAGWLEQLESDPAALDQLRDFDRLRHALAPAAVQPRHDASADTSADVHAEPVAAPPQGWAAFERRLTAALADAGRESVAPAALTFSRGGWRVGLLAACLLMVGGAGGWWLSHQAAPPSAATNHSLVRHPAPPLASPHAIPTSAEVAEQVRAFTEVSRVLDHQAAWLSLSERSSDVGLAPQPVTATQRLLLLRLSVHRGRQLVSRSDLIIVPGHSAELKVPVTAPDGSTGKELRYVINVSDEEPAMLSLWVELAAPGEPSRTLAALATQLRPEPGQVRSAGELVAGSDEYRVKVGFSQPRPRPSPPPPAAKDHL